MSWFIKQKVTWCFTQAVGLPWEFPVPLWTRGAYLGEDGTVFVPAKLTGNETFILLRAALAGIEAVLSDIDSPAGGLHVYLPAE